MLPENEHELTANSESVFVDCSPCAPSEARVLVLEPVSSEAVYVESFGVDVKETIFAGEPDTPESVDCENIDSEPDHSGPLEVVKSAVLQPSVQALAQPAVAQPVAQSVAQSPVQPLSSSAGCSEELIQMQLRAAYHCHY